jgi:DNA modification methylase
MTREGKKSEVKSLIDDAKFKKLQPIYVKLVDNLVKNYPIIKEEFFTKLVNFKKNKAYPKHSWFDYKHGYAEDLVRALIERNGPSKKLNVLDPFCGVGTTNLVAQALGYKSTGFDVSPLAVLAAKTKTYNYSDLELKEIENLIKNLTLKNEAETPDSDLIKKAYTEENLKVLLQIKYSIDQIENLKIQDFFKIAYLSILENSSNRKKDGNGLKIVRNRPHVGNISYIYKAKLQSMLIDLKDLNLIDEVSIYDGSIINLGKKVKSDSIGITITSPPYANCFDYCEVYKLELWMGGFVKSYSDFAKYRNDAIRSHVNAKFDHTIFSPNQDVDLIAECISCFNVWNKNIPDMVRGYFDDMQKVIQEIYRVSRRGAKCYIVVANSCYRGILVPTDLLLAKIGEAIGFEVEPIIFARRIRTSSQQMNEIHESFGELMRESIVVLKKP